jgi:hypothetical protein
MLYYTLQVRDRSNLVNVEIRNWLLVFFTSLLLSIPAWLLFFAVDDKTGFSKLEYGETIGVIPSLATFTLFMVAIIMSTVTVSAIIFAIYMLVSSLPLYFPLRTSTYTHSQRRRASSTTTKHTGDKPYSSAYYHNPVTTEYAGNESKSQACDHNWVTETDGGLGNGSPVKRTYCSTCGEDGGIRGRARP